MKPKLNVWKYGIVLTCVLVVIAAFVGLAMADEQSDVGSETPVSVPIGDEVQSPKITEEKKEVLMDISERWLMENGSREYVNVSKEFVYLKESKSMDTIWHEYEVTCYINSTLLDRYHFTVEENMTTKDIKISSVEGPLTEDLTVEPLEERKLLRNENVSIDNISGKYVYVGTGTVLLILGIVLMVILFKKRGDKKD